MKRSASYIAAERTGRGLGRFWRGLMRLQSGCRKRMLRAGLPPAAANLVIAAIWILVVAVLLRHGLWLAVGAAVVLVLISLGHADIANCAARQPEWRDDYAGPGLYDAHDFRVDPYDPDKMS
jgi:hypothetical protein